MTNKEIVPGFETQSRRHKKSKTGVPVALQNDRCPPNFFFKKTDLIIELRTVKERVMA